MGKYQIGDQFVDRTDKRVTASITDKQKKSGIPHYKLSVEPNVYNVEPRWISEYGILMGFEPMGRGGRPSRKPKNPITAFLKSIFG